MEKGIKIQNFHLRIPNTRQQNLKSSSVIEKVTTQTDHPQHYFLDGKRGNTDACKLKCRVKPPHLSI